MRNVLPEGFDRDEGVIEQMRSVISNVNMLQREGGEEAVRYLSHSGMAVQDVEYYEPLDRRTPVTIGLQYFKKAYRHTTMLSLMGEPYAKESYGHLVEEADVETSSQLLGYACVVGYIDGISQGSFHGYLRYGVRGALQIAGISVARVAARTETEPDSFLQSQISCIRASDIALEAIARCAIPTLTREQITERNRRSSQE